jgi:hypothetical protein
MSDNTTQSSANTDPQLLLESGPMLLKDFNPKAILRFTGRKCSTCDNEIMEHWLRPNDDPDLRGEYWCSKEGPSFSLGLAEATWDVPEGFGKNEAVETAAKDVL